MELIPLLPLLVIVVITKKIRLFLISLLSKEGYFVLLNLEPILKEKKLIIVVKIKKKFVFLTNVLLVI